MPVNSNYVYLVMVDPKNNNYKFYEMKDNGDNTFTVRYGRVGGTSASLKRYPMSKWTSTYNSKVRKGYEDQTAYYSDQGVDTPQGQPTAEVRASREDVRKEKGETITDEQFELWAFLKKYTKQTMQRVFTRSSEITRGMVDGSKQLVQQLYHTNDVDEFNSILMHLMAICPRHVGVRVSRNSRGGVETWLACDQGDFRKIIDREENLIQAMESQLAYRSKKAVSTVTGQVQGYITDPVRTATQEQVEVVMNHLPSDLRQRVHKVYVIEPQSQNKKFEGYCKTNAIRKTKLLWHGSRNENWLSILATSLSLNPNAVITGKMFGNGIYFAPDAHKSWGYTSSRNAYWTNENSSYAIMGLFETAYGKPLNCDCAYSYTKRYLDNCGKNCVHAHAGRSLYRDEIIYYDESAMVLRYLVVFDA